MSYYKQSLATKIKEWAIVITVVIFFGGFVYLTAVNAVQVNAQCNGVVVRNYWGFPDCLESAR